MADPNPASRFASIISFLSIIPIPTTKHAEIHKTAQNMYLFPVVGVIIGLMAGLLVLGLHHVIYEPLLAGLAAAAFLLIITGLHHTDGLADMADGLMARGGGYKRRLDAMKDKNTGTAGVTAIVLCVAGLVLALSVMNGMNVIIVLCGMILAEALAKFSMVVLAMTGRPATPNSTGAIFAKAAKSAKFKAAAVAIMAIIIIILMIIVPIVVAIIIPVYYFADIELGQVHFISFMTLAVMTASSVVIPLILAAISRRSFGGITGDVFGASNEITRIVALGVLVSV